MHLLLTAALLLPAQGSRVQPATYPSTVFAASRPVFVYMPPETAGRPVGLLICLWGRDYVEQIAAPSTLDALIRAGRMPPIAAVFLDDGEDRFQDFATTTRTARSVVEELIPWARASRHLEFDARHTIVAGYAAGLAAGYAGFMHAEAIGNVLAQSGAFWRGFDGEGASGFEWISAQVSSAPARAVRFSLEVGGAETRPSGGSGVSIKTANEHLRDALSKKGYHVDYREVPAAQHEFGHWRAAFGDALIALVEDWRQEADGLGRVLR